MTVPDESFAPDDTSSSDIIPVDVRVVSDLTETETVSPEFGSCQAYTIPLQGTGPPLQILTRVIKRKKAYVEVNFSVSASVWFATRPDPLTLPNPQGYLVNVPVPGLYRLPDWENQQPLYCVASVAGLSVSVTDQRFGVST